jgi:hypothetical protein
MMSVRLIILCFPVKGCRCQCSRYEWEWKGWACALSMAHSDHYAPRRPAASAPDRALPPDAYTALKSPPSPALPVNAASQPTLWQ